jgi:ribosomal protein S18 acetylase RimI-like enzyme
MEQFAGAAFDVILLDGESIGRLYVDRRPDEIRIIDIALLPEYRNRGIGSRLITALLAEGTAAGLPVRIHVEQYNPAMRLYNRLGFQKIDERGVYHLMEWSPARAPLDAEALPEN